MSAGLARVLLCQGSPMDSPPAWDHDTTRDHIALVIAGTHDSQDYELFRKQADVALTFAEVHYHHEFRWMRRAQVVALLALVVAVGFNLFA